MNPENTSAPKTRLSLFRNWISFIGAVVGLGALFSFRCCSHWMRSPNFPIRMSAC